MRNLMTLSVLMVIILKLFLILRYTITTAAVRSAFALMIKMQLLVYGCGRNCELELFPLLTWSGV